MTPRPGQRSARPSPRPILRRVFITLAACCFVGAFAIAALAPVGLTLTEGLQRLDRTIVASLRMHVPDAAWRGLVMPFLARPAWVLPAMLGIVCAGVAMSIDRPPGSDLRRRRP